MERMCELCKISLSRSEKWAHSTLGGNRMAHKPVRLWEAQSRPVTGTRVSMESVAAEMYEITAEDASSPAHLMARSQGWCLGCKPKHMVEECPLIPERLRIHVKLVDGTSVSVRV